MRKGEVFMRCDSELICVLWSAMCQLCLAAQLSGAVYLEMLSYLIRKFCITHTDSRATFIGW